MKTQVKPTAQQIAAETKATASPEEWKRRTTMERWTLHEMCCNFAGEEPALIEAKAKQQVLSDDKAGARMIYRAIKDDRLSLATTRVSGFLK